MLKLILVSIICTLISSQKCDSDSLSTVSLKLSYSYFLRGYEAMQSQNYEKALEFYELADTNMLENDKFDYSHMYNDLGLLYSGKNDLTNAVQAFKKGVSRNPNFIPVVGNLANTLALIRDDKGAIEVYEYAMRSKNTAPEVIHNYAVFW
jgi:tetratricopeptide (TPR) repeat protein